VFKNKFRVCHPERSEGSLPGSRQILRYAQDDGFKTPKLFLDTRLQSRAEQLASEMASQARTIEDLNGLMRRMKWTDIIAIFDFPPPIRKAIYTTNVIESVNSVIRKFTRNRKIYPNEESAVKLIFMAIREAAKRWTMPIHHWKEALNHFAIMFEDRMPMSLSK
jgi:putative transposase